MNKNKKILFLSPFFYPEGISTGKYNTYLVRALVKYGIHVDVVASYPFYPDWHPEKTDASIDGVKIHRGGLNIKYPKSQVLKRLILEFWFLYHVMKYLLLKRNEVNKIIVVFPPVFVTWGINIFLHKKVFKIGILHDLQGVMAKTENSLVRSLVSFLIFKIERRAFRKMDKIICLSNSMSDILVNDYKIDRSCIEVFYPFMTLKNTLDSTNRLSSMFDSRYLHIVYSGALGEKQRPLELLNLFRKISELRKDIVCHIISRGPGFDLLKEGSREESRVLFHDLVPEELLDELYMRSTMQIIPQASGTGAGAFPSKLPNLLSSGVPVYAICDKGSELSDVISKFGFCRVGYHWDLDLLAKAIVEFIDEIKNLSHEALKTKYNGELDKLFGVAELVKSIVDLNSVKNENSC